jgi:hypothetical protein
MLSAYQSPLRVCGSKMASLLQLRTGASMPAIGFGTWQVSVVLDFIYLFLWLFNALRPRHNWSGSRPGLVSGICGGQIGVGAGLLRVLQFPLPKPFIPPSPSSQSPEADTQRPCDELITRPGSPADCPRSSNWNETESFMEAAKGQNWAVEPQEKKKL